MSSEFNVAEIFSSINGEGRRAGQLSVFIRMQGCNLRCGYCDTQWANEADCEVKRMTTKEIIGAVREAGIRNVTLTGGEPLLQPGIRELLEAFAAAPDLAAEIETNGSVPLRPFADITDRPAFTMDYKLPGSGMEGAMRTENFAVLDCRDTVKFVVSDETDLRRAKEMITEYDLTAQTNVYFSPAFGRIRPETIVNFMKAYRMNGVTLQIQMHKVIWDPQQRGV